jgi:MoaA/NifB/PqqE/SkfB family radical SAM enzyme
MARIVIELTNRCNLSCTHCFDGRHSADGEIKLEIIEKILQSAKAHGFDHLSFTGGDPTVHPRFIEIIKMVSESGYNFGFVTNGQNFTRIYEKILLYRDKLTGITFSLDGAREETHDRLRGKGSYRRVMKAVSVCVIKDIPFTFNMVITSHNRGELEEMAEGATKLGSRGLRFGHLMSTPLTTMQSLDLSPEERREAEATVWKIQKSFPMPIIIAPGYYTTDLFPCAPLQMEEINIDWRGNVTKCCHLSGHGDGVGNDDVIGNLYEMSFSEAYERLVEENRKFHKEKLEHHAGSEFKDSDYFPCWYCENYFKKLDWLKKFPNNSWSTRVWTNLPGGGNGSKWL